MYGNFCGPYWSDGQWQESVIPTLPAKDELDATCRVHDEVYARGGDLLDADRTFFRSNFGKGVLRTAFAIPVGIQSVLRASEILPQSRNRESTLTTNQKTQSHNTNMAKQMRTTKNRGTPPNPTKSAPRAQKKESGLLMSRSFPPTSIGTTIRMGQSTVQRTTDSARLTGKDFVGTVEGNGIGAFGIGKSALLSPAYFSSTVLGNLARSFERYRWNRLRIHYVPKVATTATGQVILCSSRSVSEPNLAGEQGNFLQRAMSQGNAAFSPLWTPSYIDIDCDAGWRLVDPTTTVDLDDNIHEELQVYTQVSAPGQVGYLFAEYDISFKEPIYQPHSTAIPLASGPGQRVTLGDTANTKSPLDALILNPTGTNFNAIATNGTIWRAVFDLQASTVPAGSSFANGYLTNITYRTTTVLSTSSTQLMPFQGGTTVYFVKNDNFVEVYTSLESAIVGNSSGQLFYNLATTGFGIYVFDIATVRIGVASLPSVQ
jgi:hypothetical protein